jgi:hypothetical protein
MVEEALHTLVRLYASEARQPVLSDE